MTLTLESIRRYPVKSMGGESLERVPITSRGLEGDRDWAVVDADGKFASGKNSSQLRRYDAVFTFAARTGSDGEVLVAPQADASAERAAGDPELNATLSVAFGTAVSLEQESYVTLPGNFFDEGAISLVGTATLEWAERELGATTAARRLRANLVVSTSEPFEEETWLGRRVRIGEVEVVVEKPIPRCRMVDLAQDGVAEPAKFLKGLAATREMRLAMYCRPKLLGTIEVGNLVEVH